MLSVHCEERDAALQTCNNMDIRGAAISFVTVPMPYVHDAFVRALIAKVIKRETCPSSHLPSHMETGIYIFQKVLIFSLPILPHR